jgi:hypothetical protein
LGRARKRRIDLRGVEVLVTTDKNIRHQRSLKTRAIALVVLEHSQWPMVKLVAEKIAVAVNAAQPGSYVEVEVPFKASPRKKG